MKVEIGPYPGRATVLPLLYWYQRKKYKKPYYMIKSSEVTNFDKKLESFFDAIQSGLDATINKWYYNKKKQKIKVRIDRYDTWSMDYTLAHIIHPMLVQIKETKHGSPFVDDKDVPKHLRSTAAPPKKNEWDTDEFHEARWDWVLDEMIWAFECMLDEDWDSQFHSGEFDYTWEKSDIEYDGEKTYQMKEGPNHTHVFDKKAYDKAWKRRNHAMILFGKYYHALWD